MEKKKYEGAREEIQKLSWEEKRTIALEILSEKIPSKKDNLIKIAIISVFLFFIFSLILFALIDLEIQFLYIYVAMPFILYNFWGLTYYFGKKQNYYYRNIPLNFRYVYYFLISILIIMTIYYWNNKNFNSLLSLGYYNTDMTFASTVFGFSLFALVIGWGSLIIVQSILESLPKINDISGINIESRTIYLESELDIQDILSIIYSLLSQYLDNTKNLFIIRDIKHRTYEDMTLAATEIVDIGNEFIMFFTYVGKDFSILILKHYGRRLFVDDECYDLQQKAKYILQSIGNFKELEKGNKTELLDFTLKSLFSYIEPKSIFKIIWGNKNSKIFILIGLIIIGGFFLIQNRGQELSNYITEIVILLVGLIVYHFFTKNKE